MRPARALIDLQALRHNYQVAKQLSADKALAVVKADAYGHGAVACAKALVDLADGFAVACLEEALELRMAGIAQPIVLLEGFFSADELALIEANDLWCVVHAEWQLAIIEQAHLTRPLTVWLKMDSGMHRVGFFAHEYRAAWQRLQDSNNVASIVLMSHFADALSILSWHCKVSPSPFFLSMLFCHYCLFKQYTSPEAVVDSPHSQASISKCWPPLPD